MNNELPRFMLLPDSRVRQGWDVFVGLNILACALILPFTVAMGLEHHEVPGSTLWWFNVFTTLIFLADMVVNFNTAIYCSDEYHLITDRREIARRYLRGWFSLDLLTTIPFFLITGTGGMEKTLRIFRILRLLRLLRLIKVWQQVAWRLSHSTGTGVSQMLFVIFWLPLILHWFSCGWLVINNTPVDDQLALNYVRALYWCVTTVATIGYGDITPDRNNAFAMIYTMCVMIMGAGFYGYIIGNIANILAKRDAAKVHYLEKMDRVNAFLKYQSIPSALQARIRNYYKFIWNTRRGYDEETVLDDLPVGLKVEVAMHLKREILEKVPIFKGCGSLLARELVMSMHSAVFMADEIIMRHGEIGEEMYFISRGSVAVLSADEQTTYATLSEGSFFGEIALLKRTPRTATVRALDCCDLYTLDKASFDRILERHPAFAEHIHEITAKRTA